MKKLTMLAMAVSLAAGCTVGSDGGNDGVVVADNADEFAAEIADDELGSVYFEAVRLDADTVESQLYVDGELWTSFRGSKDAEGLSVMQNIADDAKARGLSPSAVEYVRFSELSTELVAGLEAVENPLAGHALAHLRTIDGMQVMALDPDDEAENAFIMSGSGKPRLLSLRYGTCTSGPSGLCKIVKVRVLMTKDEQPANYCRFLDFIDSHWSWTNIYSTEGTWYAPWPVNLKATTLTCRMSR